MNHPEAVKRDAAAQADYERERDAEVNASYPHLASVALTETWGEFVRLNEEIVFGCHRVIEDGSTHKSYEADMSLHVPGALGGPWALELHCYIIGPDRHYRWESHSLGNLVAIVREDWNAWVEAEENETECPEVGPGSHWKRWTR